MPKSRKRNKHFINRLTTLSGAAVLLVASSVFAFAQISTGTGGLSSPKLSMSLSPTMRVFGTAINTEFGDVEETGIFLKISDIFEEKKRRHIGTYNPEAANIAACELSHTEKESN